MQAVLPFPDISPEILSISLGGFELALRWYALAYIVGILIGWALLVRLAKTSRLWEGEPPMNRVQIDELVTWMVLSIVLGGRLGYVLFYNPGQYLSAPLDVFKVWQGGMSFHGGITGVVLGTILFAWRFKVPLMSLADMLAVATPAGLMLGRIANFINAELWGRPTDLPWGVIFPGEAAQDCGQLVMTVCARHPSQLYEAGLEGLLLGALVLWLTFRTSALRQPGLIAGVFFVGYALARMFVELFRVADAQFVTPDNPEGYVWTLGSFGLHMGQLLSLPMLVLGLAFILYARRNGRT